MAVERLTDYTRRIWTCLEADDPDLNMQVGDIIYYMDLSICAIITGIPAPGSINTWDLPDIGSNQILLWNLRIVNGTTQGTTVQRNIIVLGEYDPDKHCLRRRAITASIPSRVIGIPQSLRTTPATGISRTLVMVGVNKNLTSPTYTLEGDVGFYGETDSVPELGTGYTGYLFAVYGDNAKITISN